MPPLSTKTKHCHHRERIRSQWISLNRVRVILWTVEWAGMMWYFAKRAWQGLQAASSEQ